MRGEQRRKDASPCRGGGGKYFGLKVPARSGQNERDLGLAIDAVHRLFQRMAAERIYEGRPATYTHQGWTIAKGIRDGLRARTLRSATPNQLAFLCKVLGRGAPPVADPCPPATRVLPLRPPGRG